MLGAWYSKNEGTSVPSQRDRPESLPEPRHSCPSISRPFTTFCLLGLDGLTPEMIVHNEMEAKATKADLLFTIIGRPQWGPIAT